MYLFYLGDEFEAMACFISMLPPKMIARDIMLHKRKVTFGI